MWKKKTEAEDMRLVEKNGVPYFVFKIWYYLIRLIRPMSGG